MLKAELEELVAKLRGEIFDKDLDIQDLQNMIEAKDIEKSQGKAWELTYAELSKE